MSEHIDLRTEEIIAICDTREQAPLDLLLTTEVSKLYTGDYSVRGLENLVCIERKSLPDLLGCVGRDRDRFDKCIMRMRGYEVKILVVEAHWSSIILGQWRSTLKPTQVKAALYSWMKHVNVILAGDRQNAAEIISGILYSSARDRWRQLRGLKSSLKLVSGDK